MKYNRPTASMRCKVCGRKFIAERSKVLSGARKCCSKRCRGMVAASLNKNPGRKPVHGACVGGILTALYRRWASMKARCHSASCLKYGRYGARGITVCDEWRDSFAVFRDWAIKSGFREELQIDRIDNDKGYYPANCRWVTCLKNQANRARSIIFPTGETTEEVATRLGMAGNSIRERLRRGMTKQEAMTLPYTPNGGKRKHFKRHHLNLWEPAPHD